jgi:Peptidase A4 family
VSETQRLEFPFPEPHFDPNTAPPEVLDRFGLPHLPDPDRQPELRQAWLRLFQQPLTFVPPPPEAALALVPPIRLLPSMLETTRIQRSPNWAGATVKPDGGNQLVQVFGEWVVPEPSMPPLDDQGASGQRNVYKCSTWIGLDGTRRYVDSSLPQVGTEQVLRVEADGSRKIECQAFFQWWAPDQLIVDFTAISWVPVNPGVTVMALVWAINPSGVVAVFRTFDPLNQIAVLVQNAPTVKLPDGSTTSPIISGVTAEWIAERPRPLRLGSTDLELLADFGAVEFSYCVAGTARQPGLPTSEKILETPRLLRMFEVINKPVYKTHTVGMPLRTDRTSVTVKYVTAG